MSPAQPMHLRSRCNYTLARESFVGNGVCIFLKFSFFPSDGAYGIGDVGAGACCIGTMTFFPLSASLGFAFGARPWRLQIGSTSIAPFHKECREFDCPTLEPTRNLGVPQPQSQVLAHVFSLVDLACSWSLLKETYYFLSHPTHYLHVMILNPDYQFADFCSFSINL